MEAYTESNKGSVDPPAPPEAPEDKVIPLKIEGPPAEESSGDQTCLMTSTHETKEAQYLRAAHMQTFKAKLHASLRISGVCIRPRVTKH